MNNLKVVVEHDFYSRKPINVNFKIRLLDGEGDEIHTTTFKNRSFNAGLSLAQERKRVWENPTVQLAMLVSRIGEEKGIEFDSSRGFEGFMQDLFKKSSLFLLKEYLQVAKSPEDIEYAQKELIRRLEMYDE